MRAGEGLAVGLLGGRRSQQTTAEQEGVSQQNQGDMPVPAHIAADLVLIQPQRLRSLQIFFNGPAGAVGLSHGEQRGLGGSPDQDVGQFGGIVQAPAHQQPAATVVDASMQHRQTSPIKEALAFGARTDGEAVPIARAQGPCSDTGHISEQQTGSGLDTDDFGGRDSQGIRRSRAP